MMSLTKQQALDFITEKLGVADFERKFTDGDRRGVLDEILAAWQNAVPFQTVTTMAAPPGEKLMPSIAENVTAVLELQGGRCWTTNTVLYLLLAALGYSALVSVGSVCRQGHTNHVVVMVTGLVTPGDRWVVDVGLASVSPRAVCLDFAEESEVVSGIYAPYKYIREGELYVRAHKAREGNIPGPYIIKEGWAHMYWFTGEPLTLDALQPLIKRDVYDVTQHHLNVDLFCTIVPHGRFAFLHNDRLKVEQTPGGEVTVTTLGSDAEVEEALRKYFPTLSGDVVRKAVPNWRACRAEINL